MNNLNPLVEQDNGWNQHDCFATRFKMFLKCRNCESSFSSPRYCVNDSVVTINLPALECFLLPCIESEGIIFINGWCSERKSLNWFILYKSLQYFWVNERFVVGVFSDFVGVNSNNALASNNDLIVLFFRLSNEVRILA